MRLAEPVVAAWKASLSLGFTSQGSRSVLSRREHDGPLVVQKALYPEGEGVCHAIVVHPPGGIVGGDQLGLRVDCAAQSHALLTTPGAGKWYRSAGAWARQSLDFSVAGTLEWLPRETIVFDGALAELTTTVDLAEGARFIGWEVVCLGRRGAGERFERGRLRLSTRIDSAGRTVFIDRGEIEAGGRPMHPPAGPGGGPGLRAVLFNPPPTPSAVAGGGPPLGAAPRARPVSWGVPPGFGRTEPAGLIWR